MNRAPDIESIRSTLTADLPPLDAPGRAAARDRIFGPVPPARTRRRRGAGPRARVGSWRAAAIRIVVPSVAVAVALTIVIALGGGKTAAVPSPLPPVASAEAAAILNRAAARLAAGGPLRGTEARVIREDMLQLVTDPGKHGLVYRYVLPRTMELGSDALGNSFYRELPDGQPRFADASAKAAYVRAFGPYVPIPPKPRIDWHNGPNGPDPNVLNLSAEQVLTLPTTPAALKLRLLAQRRGLSSDDEPTDLVGLAARLLTFGPTPPAVQAAVARLLATLPGVRHAGTVAIDGRIADVLAFRGGMELAFDRHSGRLLEEIDLLRRPSRGYPGVAAGAVVDAIAYSTRVVPTINSPIHVRGVAPVGGPRP